MPLVLADRVKDSTTSTGTGTITLANSPPAGFQSFSAIGNGNTTYYTISGGSEWEVGIGTFTSAGNTLSRDTVFSSSAGGTTKVNFSAGAKDVFVTLPSQRSYGIPFSTQSTTYSASSNEGILANTSGGPFTITLPASPATGTQVIVADAANTWGTNNLTLARNGSTIEGLAEDLVCDITGASVQLIYSGTTWQAFAQVGGAGGNVVTSVNASGGTTGLTFSGGPITSTGTLTLSGTLGVANGGTGATTLSANAVLLGNGTSALQTVAPGTSGNVLTSTGSAWVSQAVTPSSGTVTAVASGSLSDGTEVTLNSDGTVSAIAATVTTASVGDITPFRASGASAASLNACYIPNTAQVVLVYRDGNNSNYGTAVVGTISGTRITFGTPVVYYLGSTANTAVAYDPVNFAVVVAYIPGTSGGQAVVGALAGNTITFGTAVDINVRPSSACYDATSGAILISGRDIPGNNYPASCVVRVTGSSLTVGTGVIPASVITYFPVCFSAGARPVLIYSDANTGAQSAVIVSISGTTVTYNTAATIASSGAASTRVPTGAYNTATSSFCAFCFDGTNVVGRVGTISGTNISFGTSATVASGAVGQFFSAAYDAGSDRIIVTYYDTSLSRLRVAQGTISGTTVTFATPVTVSSGAMASVETATWYDFNSGISAVAYMPSGGSPSVVTVKNFTTNLTSNFLGISNAAYSNGQTATIQTAGSVDDAQTGLVAGQQYYAQYNGTLNTARTPYFAGTALSSTRLLIKG